MALRNGLGMNLYVEGYDLSGDTGSVDTLSGPVNLLDKTAINQDAMARMYGLRDAQVGFTSYFNDAADAQHDALQSLSEKGVMVTIGTSRGDPCYWATCQQGDYPASRGSDGSFTFSPTFSGSDGNGAEWGVLLTTGKETHASATSSTGIVGSQTTAGASAFLEGFEHDSGDATVVIEDSSDTTDGTDGTWGTLLTFSTTSASWPTSERATVTGTVEKGLRVTTTGTFVNADFAVGIRRGTSADIEDLS